MICEALKQYRAENGLSVEELASMLDIPVETVREYERVETYQEVHYMFLPLSDVLKIRELTGREILDLLSYPDTENETT